MRLRKRVRQQGNGVVRATGEEHRGASEEGEGAGAASTGPAVLLTHSLLVFLYLGFLPPLVKSCPQHNVLSLP